MNKEKSRKILSVLEAKVSGCSNCELCKTRIKTVFGSGDVAASLMIIGIAPGRFEDEQGIPFVGRSGKLLDEWLANIGWPRESVYITNTVKCRPPENRDPKEEEIASCNPFFLAQIEAVNPRVIITLGLPAARTLLNTKDPLWKIIRNGWYIHGNATVIPTYHPSYILRTNNEKKKYEILSDFMGAFVWLLSDNIFPPKKPTAGAAKSALQAFKKEYND